LSSIGVVDSAKASPASSAGGSGTGTSRLIRRETWGLRKSLATLEPGPGKWVRLGSMYRGRKSTGVSRICAGMSTSVNGVTGNHDR
jgi:hypothetical protein